jgi:hypothetical protein
MTRVNRENNKRKKSIGRQYKPTTQKCQLPHDTAIIIIGTHGEILCKKTEQEPAELETFEVDPDITILKFNLVSPGCTAITNGFNVNSSTLSCMSNMTSEKLSEYIRDSKMCDFSNLLSHINSRQIQKEEIQGYMNRIVKLFKQSYILSHKDGNEKEETDKSIASGFKVSTIIPSWAPSWLPSWIPSWIHPSRKMINKKYSVSGQDPPSLSSCDFDITCITSSGTFSLLDRITRSSNQFITTKEIIDNVKGDIKKMLIFDLSCAPLTCRGQELQEEESNRLCSDILSKGMCYGGKSKKKKTKNRRSKTQKYSK